MKYSEYEKAFSPARLNKYLVACGGNRNRIAHHEAICFDDNGNIDMGRTQSKYALILKYIDFLGYQSCHLFYGIDILPDSTIAKIEALK